MDKSKLIEDLKSLKVNAISFKEDEERIISELRKLYKENSNLFSDEDIKLIKIIDNIKDLQEDIEYCKSKESIDILISDFHDIASEVEKNENISKRIKTFIRECIEKKEKLPSEMLANEKRREIQSFGQPPHCPKCNKLLVLRDSSRGYFWGCIDFPSCWGRKNACSSKNQDNKQNRKTKGTLINNNEIENKRIYFDEIENEKIYFNEKFSDYFHDVKSRFPKHLIFIQSGCFYNVLFEDAEKCAEIFHWVLYEIEPGVACAGISEDGVEKIFTELHRLHHSYVVLSQLEGGANPRRQISKNSQSN